MNVLLGVIGVVAGLALLGYLARLVARDGYGTISPPRSHRIELGSWVEQQFRR